MASCRYHVGVPLSSTGAASEPHATTPPPPPTTAAGGVLEGSGLFLPVISDSSRVVEGIPHHPASAILISPQTDPPGVYPAASYHEQLGIPAGDAHLGIPAGAAHLTPRTDMTQLIAAPHPAHPHHHHHHHQHHHHPSSNLTSGPTSRGDPAPSVVVVSPSSRSTPVPAPTEGRKSKRVSGGCKSTYKHVPHREKAPHLVARRNARERRRVQAVNTAFVRLRRHVPHENRHKRLSKVKTLHFAIDYINYMQRLIHEYDAAVQRASGGGAGGGTRGISGGGAGGGGDHGPRTVGLPPTVDMVELNSTKENRWMPVNLVSVWL